jgi:hypothetical protein
MTTQTPRTRNRKGKFTRTLAERKRDYRAAELHGQGWSYQRIADELGFASRGHVHNAVLRAYDDLPKEGVELARRVDLERIDRLIEKNWEALEREHLAVSQGRVVRRFTGVERDEDGIERLDLDGKAIPVFEDVRDDAPVAVHSVTILRLIAQREKIFGYAAPTQSRVEVITADMVESHIAELEQQLARNDPAAGPP